MVSERLRSPFKFAVVGMVNTLVGLLTIFLCKWLLGWSDPLANICGYMLGLAVSFLLNRRWTFQHSGAVLPAIVRFLLVFTVAYFFNLGTVLLAIHYFEVNSYLAQVFGVAPYAVFFYLGSRYFAFAHGPTETTIPKIDIPSHQ